MEMGHLAPGGGLSGLLNPNTPSPRSPGVTTEQVIEYEMGEVNKIY